MLHGNAVYAQSGGVTSVINGSAYGVITEAMKADFIEKIYGGFQGINGILDENLIDLQEESPNMIEALRYTPGAALGSCRRKLPDLEKNRNEFERIVQVLEAHNIRYFFYNGGNDSMDTAYKVSQIAGQMGYDLISVGVPKTIDNDLPVTDNSPGFGSTAKYNATSLLEGGIDVASMYRDSTKVFVMETMGRHAGWIAASTALARRMAGDPPHIILLPERPVSQDKLLAKIEGTVAQQGYCVVVVSEGAKKEDGTFLADSGIKDQFGHVQLGGAVNVVQSIIKDNLGLKTHGALLDYCQRSGRHLVSRVDLEQAIACGHHAVIIAKEQLNGKMVTIVRESNDPYQWSVDHTDASNIANQEKLLPDSYIQDEGFDITDEFITYCQPLIEGEDFPPFSAGIPQYGKLKNQLIPKKLPAFTT
ncbi:MAG: 6-phosphofructokinase [SAR324 cluster bacterium]|nr:6-phosphofructokinase [SAR324 cluster bacterium]